LIAPLDKTASWQFQRCGELHPGPTSYPNPDPRERALDTCYDTEPRVPRVLRLWVLEPRVQSPEFQLASVPKSANNPQVHLAALCQAIGDESNKKKESESNKSLSEYR